MERTPELALHRFGLGARPGENGKLGAPDSWLEGQIRLQPIPSALAALPDAVAIIANSPDPGLLKNDLEARKAYQKTLRDTVIGDYKARLLTGYCSGTPLYERLVWFWSNHLAITASANLRVAPFALDYERAAIRPHVTGKFADMLIASARHPAMLFYLNNASSIGPGSIAGQRRDAGSTRTTPAR